MHIKRLLRRFLLLVGIVACVELGLYAANAVTTDGPLENRHHAPTLKVSHSLKENDLYLNMNVTGFSFSLENMGKDNRHGEGHIHLYLDGKKVAKVFETKFVLRDITAGHHEVVVELAHNNHQSYGVKQRFHIDVK
ncbi:hypothetical protein [Brevibacillus sp. H7]|jgi:hypothetical protein|uniref:hypothetical protein n=1 Tax=Brevibacillus sp. H7 TaxID=3349138 RepID=UPI0037FA34AF